MAEHAGRREMRIELTPEEQKAIDESERRHREHIASGLDYLGTSDAMLSALAKLQQAYKLIREPEWYYDENSGAADPDDYCRDNDMNAGDVFSLCGARDTGTHYFRVVGNDQLESEQITKEEYDREGRQ